MKIKPFWITKTSIGYKKILFFLSSFIIWLIFNLVFKLPLEIFVVITLVFINIILILVFLGLTKGITVFQKEIIEKNKEHFIVRDRFFPLHPSKSLRTICQPKSNVSYSSIYLKNHNSWLYLDFIRKLIKKNQPQKRSALVLGGGGAVIPLELLTSLEISSDVVEISPIMIKVAKKYFLPLRKSFLGSKISKIKLIQADAFAYTSQNKKQYGLIIVDLFVDHLIVPKIKNSIFIKKILASSEYVIVNFGLKKSSIDHRSFFEKYIK